MQGPHCQDYLDFIGEGEDKQLYRHGQDGTASVELSDDWRITFDHVSFRYPGTQEWAIRDLNLTLKKGSPEDCHCQGAL